MASAKFDFGSTTQQLTTTVIEAIDAGSDLEKIWADRGYASGAGNTITDEDLTGLNITADQLTSMMTAFIQLRNYVDNLAVIQGDYRASFNAVRTLA